MSLEEIVIGTLGGLLGAAFCLRRVPLFLILLPIWGLFTGFMVGRGCHRATLLGEGFLGQHPGDLSSGSSSRSSSRSSATCTGGARSR